jgi:hypothetical protein
MADNYKVLVYEKNGVELEYPCELEFSAANLTFDNTIVGELVAETAQEGIDELTTKVATSASPGFSFGRASNVNSGTWLQNEGVPSNKTGRWVYINDAKVTKVFVSNENSTSFSLSVYHHEGNGVSLTLMGTVVINGGVGDSFDVDWSVPSDRQLAIQLSLGTARNVVAGLELQGTN